MDALAQTILLLGLCYIEHYVQQKISNKIIMGVFYAYKILKKWNKRYCLVSKLLMEA